MVHAYGLLTNSLMSNLRENVIVTILVRVSNGIQTNNVSRFHLSAPLMVPNVFL